MTHDITSTRQNRFSFSTISLVLFRFFYRFTKELAEAGKKLKDDSIGADKKTFLKAQMPKMETEIGKLKKTIAELLDEDELDPRGEFFVLAKKLVA